VGAGGDVGGLGFGAGGRAFEGDGLGLACEREGGDDAGGEGATAEGVATRLDLAKVGDTIVVAVGKIISKRSAPPPLRTHDHSRFLSGNNSSMRLLGQEGSFSRVSISQAMGSMPFRRAVSSSD